MQTTSASAAIYMQTREPTPVASSALNLTPLCGSKAVVNSVFSRHVGGDAKDPKLSPFQNVPT